MEVKAITEQALRGAGLRWGRYHGAPAPWLFERDEPLADGGVLGLGEAEALLFGRFGAAGIENGLAERIELRLLNS